MRNLFLIRRSAHGAVAGAHAIVTGLRERSALGEMVGEQLRLVRRQFGEALFERARNALMPFAPAAQKQTLIGGVPHQRVLEAVAPFQAAPFGKDDARRDQLVERGVERCTVPGGDRDKQREARIAGR